MKWDGKLNRKYTQISAYVIVTAVIIYILSLMASNAPVILREIFEKLGWLVKVIKPVIIGFVIAYLLEPVVRFFEKKLERFKWLRGKRSKIRLFSVLITILIIVVALTGLVSLLVYTITDQVTLVKFQDVAILIKQFFAQFQAFFDSVANLLKELDIETVEIKEYVVNLADSLGDIVKNTVSTTAGSLGNVTGWITTMAFSVIIAVWFLIDGAMMTKYLNKVIYALCNQKVNQRVHQFVKDADEVFSGYVRGQLLDALVMMCLISISLSVIGVKFAVVIGVLAGFGNLIPYIGPFVAYAGTGIVCLLGKEFRLLVIACIILAVIQFIDANYIGPKLLSRSISVHPLLVIISLIFGSAIGGFLGMLLAVPVGALIKLMFVRYIDIRAEKKDYELGNTTCETEKMN